MHAVIQRLCVQHSFQVTTGPHILPITGREKERAGWERRVGESGLDVVPVASLHILVARTRSQPHLFARGAVPCHPAVCWEERKVGWDPLRQSLQRHLIFKVRKPKFRGFGNSPKVTKSRGKTVWCRNLVPDHTPASPRGDKVHGMLSVIEMLRVLFGAGPLSPSLYELYVPRVRNPLWLGGDIPHLNDKINDNKVPFLNLFPGTT